MFGNLAKSISSIEFKLERLGTEIGLRSSIACLFIDSRFWEEELKGGGKRER